MEKRLSIVNCSHDVCRIITDCGYEYDVLSGGHILDVKRSKILSEYPDKKGYLRVNIKCAHYSVYRIHRIVAWCFCGGYKFNLQVNHKDECKTNNNASNLEWCSPKYNSNYGERNMKLSRPVIQFKDGKIIKVWPSTRSAIINGFQSSNIVACCLGRYKSHKGYQWQYVNVILTS